jgi:formate/nitrite transporter FocA (FNT family)
MYFLPVALFIQAFDPSFAPSSPPLLWSAFVVDNLVPVTLGNVIGGAVLVAAVYWAVYLRRSEMRTASEPSERERRR